MKCPEGSFSQSVTQVNDARRPPRAGFAIIIWHLCFEQKYEKYQNFLSEKLPFLVVKFSVYLTRHVFVMGPRVYTMCTV